MHDPDRYRPTERFGDRVDDYRRYRPGYPAALTRWLIEEAGLEPGDTVADIGAGTGLLSRDLLAAGLRVQAVEPNAAMRAAADAELRAFANFTSVAGTAEATGLAAASVRLLTAAQAFHWFVPGQARAEARRILVPGGMAALIWNVRRLAGPFALGYEDLLLRHCPDYAAGQPHQASLDEIVEFFGDAPIREARFDYVQPFDFDGLKGRLLSSSYTPPAGNPDREPLLAELQTLFDSHQRDGKVIFEYDCRAYLATMLPA